MSFFLFFFFFRRVKTPEPERRCRARRLSTSSLFSTRMSEAMRRLTVLGCITVTSRVHESCPGELVAALSEGLVNQPWQQRQGDRHTGRRTEPKWALLEGFFASPSLNESNPYEWMGNERPAPEILAFLIMFIINSRTLIISLHSFCLINKWCACTFGLVYTREREEEREREGQEK